MIQRMYYLIRKSSSHKWRISQAPPEGVEVHEKSSELYKAAVVRRSQLNSAIQAERDAKKGKPRGLPGKSPGRPKTGKAKQRVVLSVPPDIVAAIPGNKNEYGNKALANQLERDGLI